MPQSAASPTGVAELDTPGYAKLSASAVSRQKEVAAALAARDPDSARERAKHAETFAKNRLPQPPSPPTPHFATETKARAATKAATIAKRRASESSGGTVGGRTGGVGGTTTRAELDAESSKFKKAQEAAAAAKKARIVRFE